MHTLTPRSNMPKLPHHCLIAVCLVGFLLLLTHSCASLHDSTYDYDSTALPEYDYNATFEYTFFSNGSSDDLEELLKPKDDEETRYDVENTETDITQEKNLDLYTSAPTVGSKASRTVYPTLLLTVVLTAHQMLRFL